MSTPTPRAVLTAAVLTLVVTLLPAAPAQAQTQERYVNQARAVTNDRRDAHDLAKLRSQWCVQKFARRQARKMARQERMFHQDLGHVLDSCDLTGVAENVAYGYPTGRRVVRAWMQSPGHRANLLEPSYRLLGMAASRGDDGSWYAAQVFGRR